MISIINFPENSRELIANFPLMFRVVTVCKQDIDPLLQEYAEKKG